MTTYLDLLERIERSAIQARDTAETALSKTSSVQSRSQMLGLLAAAHELHRKIEKLLAEYRGSRPAQEFPTHFRCDSCRQTLPTDDYLVHCQKFHDGYAIAVTLYAPGETLQNELRTEDD